MAEGSYAGVALASGRMTIAIQRPGTEAAVISQYPVTAAEPVPTVAAIADRLREAAVLESGTGIVAVGTSVGGHVSEDERTVRFAPGLIQPEHDWTDVDLATQLEAVLGLPVVVDNDVNCMTEYHRLQGYGADKKDFLVIYLAPDVRGLGSGIVTSGQLVRGASGGAGELGHLVIQPEGPRCRCGNRGCLEAMLVVDNFDRDLNWGRHAMGVGFRHGAALAAAGEERAQRVFSRAGRYLGQGLANVINLLNPELVILGGPAELVSAEPVKGSSSKFFMDALHQAVEDNTFSKMAEDCTIAVSNLDLELAARGAALMAQERAPAPAAPPLAPRARQSSRKGEAS